MDINGIRSGQYDYLLDDLSEAIKFRRKALANRKMREFEVGDIVTFVNLGAGAKYLNGIKARVLDLNFKTVWVSILPEDRARIAHTRFGRSTRIKVYPGNIELSYLDGEAQEALYKLMSGFMRDVTPEEVGS